MDFGNRYDGIDKYAVRLIKRKSKQLVGQTGFTQSDREDLEQDLIFDLLCHLPKYDPERAKKNTFINCVVEHRIANIIKSRKVGKRDYRLLAYSLNEIVEDEDGNRTEHIANINQNEYFIKTGKLSSPLEELGELSLDIEKAIADLPQDFSILCRSLQEETVSEISRNMGITRGTIYRSIKKIREVLENAGIENYF